MSLVDRVMDETEILAALLEGNDVEKLRALVHDLPPRFAPACWRRIGALAGAPQELWEEVKAYPDARVARAFLEGVGAHGLTEELVVEALDSPHWLVAEEACFLAGELGDVRVVPRLVELALGHEEPLVREAALGALGALGDDRAIPAVLAALGASNVYLRRRAVVVASAFEDPQLRQALTLAREDRDPQVRAILAELDAGAEEPDAD